jgi:glycosyltransferase A (GT-A) superfamily protein (DUF2064 family)
LNPKKHAFLLFTKAPMPGVTKTRLTEARGGLFSPEDAADLYQSMLLDVADIGFRALAELNAKASGDGAQPQQYDFVVSCSSEADQELLRNLFAQTGPWPAPIAYITDHGKIFDEHFDDAFRQLFAQGYHSVVSIGGDLPTMPVTHLVRAFEWLAYFDTIHDGAGGFVQAPCQACGVSLVGYTRETPMDSQGVFYSLEGIPALDAYVVKAQEHGVPVALLDPVADVDNVEDLAHTISLLRAIAYSSNYQPELCVAGRTLTWVNRKGIVISTPPNLEHDPREMIDA